MTDRRTVLVTGGSRGIGLGVVQALADQGYRAVAIARRDTEALQAAAAAAHPAAICFEACDLSDIAALPASVRRWHETYGPLYGLVNNAGLGTAGVLATMPDHAIADLVHLNVTATLLLTKHVVRAMMAGGGRRIVNIGSIVASTGYSGLAAYSATKSAMGGFSRSLARELGPLGITVNTVAPGFVDTEMTGELTAGQRDRIARRSALGRLAGVADVASAVVFLMSDAAAHMTGTVLTVDAGNTA